MFIDDKEKMVDFLNMDKESFLRNYSYLTEDEYEDTVKACVKLAYEADLTGDVSAEYMTEILTDSDVHTWKMYEDLYVLYDKQTEEGRYLINRVLGILTGQTMEEIAKGIVKNSEVY